MHWLPELADWALRLPALRAQTTDRWAVAAWLAQHRLDFVRTNQLDAVMRQGGWDTPAGRPVRLAILASCTTAQLQAGIRVGGLRRDIPITIHEAAYGQYWQALSGEDPALDAFAPTDMLFVLDAHHLAAGIDAGMDAAAASAALAAMLARIRACWDLARRRSGCGVIQQMPLPLHPPLMGGNEDRLPGSSAAFLARLTAELRVHAPAAGVDVLALDVRAARDGLAAWHNSRLWHLAKQEVSPAAAPYYGDLVARILAARQGRAKKCLVLDLDNTLWGGVIGDDGMAGLVLGQGSALGEAFAAFQVYARDLSRRGVILAVCSKNDEATALEPFDRHPEMVLRRGDIACFVANWADKPANLRAIALALNIGLDSLVFVDDNPFERALVRQELPMVAVPEMGEDPTFFVPILADAGYFEALAMTDEDRARAGQYQQNRVRAALLDASADLSDYLRSLEMRLAWRRFDAGDLVRVVQLINKTNQFNLTTRRYTADEVRPVIDDPHAVGLQLRLRDRFGDNGIIAIIIGRIAGDDFVVDTWLMSCRVLGRQVETATLNLVAAVAQGLGARRIIGLYVPSQKNAMVRDHYEKLGFRVVARDDTGGSRAELSLDDFVPATGFIDVQEG